MNQIRAIITESVPTETNTESIKSTIIVVSAGLVLLVSYDTLFNVNNLDLFRFVKVLTVRFK